MLTAKQEKFVQGIVSGLSQRQAYKRAFNCENMKEKTIDNKASALFNNEEIRGRYKEMIEEHKGKALWTREKATEKLIWLAEEAEANIINFGVKQANSNAFINAIKELNTLEDLYPKKNKDEDKDKEKEVVEALKEVLKFN